jgi:hypothetical protein
MNHALRTLLIAASLIAGCATTAAPPAPATPPPLHSSRVVERTLESHGAERQIVVRREVRRWAMTTESVFVPEERQASCDHRRRACELAEAAVIVTPEQDPIDGDGCMQVNALPVDEDDRDLLAGQPYYERYDGPLRWSNPETRQPVQVKALDYGSTRLALDAATLLDPGTTGRARIQVLREAAERPTERALQILIDEDVDTRPDHAFIVALDRSGLFVRSWAYGDLDGRLTHSVCVLSP